MPFLDGFERRLVRIRESHGLEIQGLILGQGAQPLEVLLAHSSHRPSAADLKNIWKARHGGRAAPVLFVVLYAEKAVLCGPSGDPPPVFADLNPSRVERICCAALELPDRHAALRFLHQALPEVESVIPGLRNEGLFATHELEVGMSRRPDWTQSVERARAFLNRRGRPLLESLGFAIEPLPGPASVLRAAKTKIAIAVLLERHESPDITNPRFSQLSPVSYAITKAEEENLPFVFIVSDSIIRLHPVRQSVGVGRRGRTETFIELNLNLLEEANSGLLPLIFSADALQENGAFDQILESSRRFAGDLGVRLRERIHSRVIPPLAEALIRARALKNPSAGDLAKTYEMALVLLFRILFVAYAEDKDLLPYRANELYRARSLKQKSCDLVKILETRGFGAETTHWDDVLRIFRAIDKGSKEWAIPAYNGGLFSSDATIMGCGALLEDLRLPNNVFGPILAELLLDETPEGRGPVDFRSLGVREFGTIYEGLLENELSVASTDLTVDKSGAYRPVKKRSDEVIVPSGRPYLHTSSGARKSSGSYFTPDFAVDHLLDFALEPALRDHLVRLEALKDAEMAAAAFFDFRVADIAMGSGHFLVSAVDRIEKAFSGYLARRRLPHVFEEIGRLRNKASEALGPASDELEIEDSQLLRRQIARRCIFGVDLNPIAVQLARLSIWIHTFVPGLPLSFLDHNLVEGNSLVGIATVGEAEAELKQIIGPIFTLTSDELIGSAREGLGKLAGLSDADAAEVELARRASSEARAAVKPAEALFDILAAARIEEIVCKEVQSWPSLSRGDLEALPKTNIHAKARETLVALHQLHFPIAFPEVFLRDRAGFDVIIGNPPWEKAKVEEHGFWMRYIPGFRSLPQHEQETSRKAFRKERPDLISLYENEVKQAELLRRTLTAGPFPGMGTGDPDLYKAFAWRFWQLASPEGGRIGVVLPRPVVNSKGSEELRFEIFENGRLVDLTTVLNNRQWVFADVHPQYTIALVTIEKKKVEGQKEISFRGPYRDMARFKVGVSRPAPRYRVLDVLSWTDTAALPLLPDDTSGEVFAQLRKSPRLDLDDKKSWFARPYTELHATNDKDLMAVVAERPEGFWPVFKGESFDIWTPDTGTYYAWADPEKVLDTLQRKRLRARTSFEGFPHAYLLDKRTLPCLKPRIAFRDITNRTNRRTVLACLVPAKVFLTHKAPHFLWPRGDEADQAFLLGILCSIPLDWYSRRFVETNVTYFILNAFPVPRPSRTDPLWQRTIALAGRLAAADKRFSGWAQDAGVECGRLEDDEKEDMIHELDAASAHLYGLSEKQLVHIFETFHEGWDYGDRLKGVLEYFHDWSQKK
jgi:hypothetical protein